MKSIYLRHALPSLAFFLSFTAKSQSKPPQLGKDAIPVVIKAMTLEEKVRLVVGRGLTMGAMHTVKLPDDQPADKVSGAAGTTFAIPRLGIPSIVLSDGPSGVHLDSTRKDHPGKTYYATAWPVETLLASSWDTALVKKVGMAFGREAKDYGVDIMLAPGANIHRTPLGGRNFEYVSEDPLLTGEIAAAMINGIQSNGVGTSIKHFAGNEQETNRYTLNTIASERALREIYLKGFEIAIRKSNPWTVMSSYNYINGIYSSENTDLLTKILRDDWKFKGFVMSDWFAGYDAVVHVKAGNDLLTPGTDAQITAIMDAIKNKQLPESDLDRNITRILNIIIKTPTFQQYKYSEQPDLKSHAELSRFAAAESMILLKNQNNALPFKQKQLKVALFGNNGYELHSGGSGSGDLNKSYLISLFQGLKSAGYQPDENLKNTFVTYHNDYLLKHPKKIGFAEMSDPSPRVPEITIDSQLLNQSINNDIAVIAIGRSVGEGADAKVIDYELSESEIAMISTVAKVFHAKNKKVVIVLNIGNPINLSPMQKYADAILLAWQPGQEGGNAIVDVLSGKVNPSGKLATTFPNKYNDVPSSKSFPGKEYPDKPAVGILGMKVVYAEITYDEGIYVGYRYYNKFNVKPVYEFGYGLSYTNFSYSPVKLNATTFNNKLTVTVTITNTGKVAGKEVVELYVSAPTNKLDKPVEELKGFAKTDLLQPGKSQTITLALKPEDLASYHTDVSSWIADAGKYTVKIGASSLDIKSSASFNLPKDILVEKDHKALTPQAEINEMKR